MPFYHMGELPLREQSPQNTTMLHIQIYKVEQTQNVTGLAQFFLQRITASSYTLAVGTFYLVSYLTVASVHHGKPPN